MDSYLSKSEVSEQYGRSSWQGVVFAEFEATLLSNTRKFPCVFGVSALKSDQLRYVFLDTVTPDALAPILKAYLKVARSFGSMSSLVVFARPGPVMNIESYRDQFWNLLGGLEAIDPAPRPADVPDDLDDPKWEFCFAGEPMFVVCNTPAHVLRQSRRSTSYMLTFQPRWVFEGVTDTDAPAAKRALQKVRDYLSDFDAISPAPYLGSYGATENREYEQYFIDDTNEVPACPYHNFKSKPQVADLKKGKVA